MWLAIGWIVCALSAVTAVYMMFRTVSGDTAHPVVTVLKAGAFGTFAFLDLLVLVGFQFGMKVAVWIYLFAAVLTAAIFIKVYKSCSIQM